MMQASVIGDEIAIQRYIQDKMLKLAGKSCATCSLETSKARLVLSAISHGHRMCDIRSYDRLLKARRLVFVDGSGCD